MRLRALAASAAMFGSTLVLGGVAPAVASQTSAPTTVVARAAGITVAGPKQVEVGGLISITGKVKTKIGKKRVARRVRLSERVGRTWHVVATTKSRRPGSYTFRIAAGRRAVTRVFRVDAPRVKGLKAVRTSLVAVRVIGAPTVPTSPQSPTVDPPLTDDDPYVPPTTDEPPVVDNPPVTPPTPPTSGDWDPAEIPSPTAPAPLGDPNAWAYLTGGQDLPSRWNPCQTVTWAYNPTAGYPTALDDLKRVFALISGVSGLHFKYVGSASYLPFVGTGTPNPLADIHVGWSTEQVYPELASSVAGIGGGTSMTYEYDVRDKSNFRITGGGLLLDAGENLTPGVFDEWHTTWGQIMTHEVMHALGLGHPYGNTSYQVMSPLASLDAQHFGAGDVTGLHKIGADAGCFW